MTPEQIKEKRRQRILARSQQIQKQQSDENQPLITQETTNQKKQQDQSPISSFQRFKLSQQYEHNKNRLNYLAILIGFIAALIQYLFSDAFILFYIFLIGITINIIIIEKMFGSLYQIAEKEEVVKHLQQIKQISVINKVLKWRETGKPILKYISGYVLTAVALGFMEPERV